MSLQKEKPEETKEEFCSACVAGIAALAGVGTVGGSRSAKNKKIQKALFWIGVTVSVVSIVVLAYLLFIRPCSSDCQ